ncbi:MAG: efflux RND transporter periplasmic adaptor subunit [Patescibacteria group bacterium]|nr:efflux RND transporter periplasmic adaptor subunit [Patescibacteria group bacterium]
MKFLKRLKRRKYIITGIVIIIIIAIFALRGRSNDANIESAAANRQDVIEQVSVTGKVSPISKADLAFEKSGVVAKIYVKVGDSVKAGQALAVLDNAADLANLQSAQAKLEDLSRSLRPEEMSVEQAKVSAAKVALANAKNDALNAVRDGYVKAQSALVNYADSLFTNPQSANPLIKVVTQSAATNNAINAERVKITDIMTLWKNDVANANDPEKAATLIGNADKYLSSIKIFMNDLTAAVNYLNPGNSGLAQSAIDVYASDINAAQSAINQSVSSITNAKSSLEASDVAYQEAESSFELKVAGSSNQAIQAQAASVASFRAILDNDTLTSPIDGIVTKAEPDIGEFVSAGSNAFSVQSYGSYKIEAYVPEADIAKVRVGDTARVTLDAYGPDTIFDAAVTAIDPAETMLEGVPTYKVTLQFSDKDNRIRSGMTANTDIKTNEHLNVLAVPSRAIIDDNGDKTIRLLNEDGKTYTSVPVKVGLKGYDGMTEVISGIKEGDKVVTYVK